MPVTVLLKVRSLLPAFNVRLLDKVTASPMVCTPLVVILPLSCVVPPKSVLKLAALTVLVNRAVPVLFAANAPSCVAFPTAPVKVMLPLPVLRVSPLVSPV